MIITGTKRLQKVPKRLSAVDVFTHTDIVAKIGNRNDSMNELQFNVTAIKVKMHSVKNFCNLTFLFIFTDKIIKLFRDFLQNDFSKRCTKWSLQTTTYRVTQNTVLRIDHWIIRAVVFDHSTSLLEIIYLRNGFKFAFWLLLSTSE